MYIALKQVKRKPKTVISWRTVSHSLSFCWAPSKSKLT